jgi:hypothetical protein
MNQPGKWSPAIVDFRMQIADLRAQNLAIGNAFASQSAI